MYGYLLWLLILFPFLLLSAWASAKVNTTYSKYDRIPNRSNMTGYDTAMRLMRNRGINDVSVERVNGKLTDHYHPTKKKVNLSMSTYGSASVGAVAVAAHEVGHVMQKKRRVHPLQNQACDRPRCKYRIRTRHSSRADRNPARFFDRNNALGQIPCICGYHCLRTRYIVHARDSSR